MIYTRQTSINYLREKLNLFIHVLQNKSRDRAKNIQKIIIYISIYFRLFFVFFYPIFPFFFFPFSRRGYRAREMMLHYQVQIASNKRWFRVNTLKFAFITFSQIVTDFRPQVSQNVPCKPLNKLLFKRLEALFRSSFKFVCRMFLVRFRNKKNYICLENVSSILSRNEEISVCNS